VAWARAGVQAGLGVQEWHKGDVRMAWVVWWRWQGLGGWDMGKEWWR
jgi:hypothetical protein